MAVGVGGFPKVGGLARDPLLPHAYLLGSVCLGVWGYGGMYAIIVLSRLCREESLKGGRVAPLPPPPFPLRPCSPPAPGLVCEKIPEAWLELGVKRKNGWTSA